MPADFPWTQADAMYLLLVRRADQLRAHRGSAMGTRRGGVS